MTTNERRPIPTAPGYTIDRLGQVYRHASGRAVRVPSDAEGRIKIIVGRSCAVINRREILGVVWPDEVVVESTVATLDKIEAEADPAPVKPKTRARRRRRGSVDEC